MGFYCSHDNSQIPFHDLQCPSWASLYWFLLHHFLQLSTPCNFAHLVSVLVYILVPYVVCLHCLFSWLNPVHHFNFKLSTSFFNPWICIRRFLKCLGSTPTLYLISYLFLLLLFTTALWRRGPCFLVDTWASSANAL